MYRTPLEGAAYLHGGYQVGKLSVNLLYQRVNILEIEVVFLYLASYQSTPYHLPLNKPLIQVRLLELTPPVLLHYVLEPILVDFLPGWHFLFHLLLSTCEGHEIFPLPQSLVLGLLTRNQHERCPQ